MFRPFGICAMQEHRLELCRCKGSMRITQHMENLCRLYTMPQITLQQYLYRLKLAISLLAVIWRTSRMVRWNCLTRFPINHFFLLFSICITRILKLLDQLHIFLIFSNTLKFKSVFWEYLQIHTFTCFCVLLFYLSHLSCFNFPLSILDVE